MCPIGFRADVLLSLGPLVLGQGDSDGSSVLADPFVRWPLRTRDWSGADARLPDARVGRGLQESSQPSPLGYSQLEHRARSSNACARTHALNSKESSSLLQPPPPPTPAAGSRPFNQSWLGERDGKTVQAALPSA